MELNWTNYLKWAQSAKIAIAGEKKFLSMANLNNPKKMALVTVIGSKRQHRNVLSSIYGTSIFQSFGLFKSAKKVWDGVASSISEEVLCSDLQASIGDRNLR